MDESPVLHGLLEVGRARQVSVIETRLRSEGKGYPESPMRQLTDWWTSDGEHLASVDPWVDPIMDQFGDATFHALEVLSRHWPVGALTSVLRTASRIAQQGFGASYVESALFEEEIRLERAAGKGPIDPGLRCIEDGQEPTRGRTAEEVVESLKIDPDTKPAFWDPAPPVEIRYVGAPARVANAVEKWFEQRPEDWATLLEDPERRKKEFALLGDEIWDALLERASGR